MKRIDLLFGLGSDRLPTDLALLVLVALRRLDCREYFATAAVLHFNATCSDAALLNGLEQLGAPFVLGRVVLLNKLRYSGFVEAGTPRARYVKLIFFGSLERV